MVHTTDPYHFTAWAHYRGQQPTCQLSGWGCWLPQLQSSRLPGWGDQRAKGLRTLWLLTRETSWRVWLRGLSPPPLKSAEVESGNCWFSASVHLCLTCFYNHSGFFPALKLWEEASAPQKVLLTVSAMSSYTVTGGSQQACSSLGKQNFAGWEKASQSLKSKTAKLKGILKLQRYTW